MSKFVLVSVVLLVFLAVPAYGQVLINEYYTGTPDFYELVNTGTAPVDISGWRVDTWYALSAVIPSVDTSFTFPAGTILPPGGFVVGQDSSTGTGPTVFYVGANLYWTSNRTTEIALFDVTGAAVDYVYGDYFGYGPSPNKPAGTNWVGNYVPGVGNDGNWRISSIDTDNAADWFSGSLSTPNAPNPPPTSVSGLMINEFYTGAIPAVELYNANTTLLDLSGFTLASWTDTGSGLVADPAFTIPAGTSVPAGGFLVLEAGGTPGTPGTYLNSMYTGIAYAWAGAMTIELALSDNKASPLGADYVIYDHFGTIAGAGPNLPSPTLWTGDFDMGTGDTHARLTATDTDTATDWAKVTYAHSLGSVNPPQTSVTGVIINEFYTGAVPAVELYNATSATVDISGLDLKSWTCASSTSVTMVADPVFTVPAGTMLPTGGFLVLESGGTAGATGTYPSSMYTGITYGWTGMMCVEIALTDSWNVALDYVFYDHFGNFAGLAPNLPSGTAWTGNFALGTGDNHERVQLADTDAATDWAKNANPQSLGTFNPPQVSGVVGIVFNEFNTGGPDYLELLNTTSAPVDVTGYVIDTWYLSGTTWNSNGATLAIPAIPPIPAGGVVCLVESGTAGTAGPYPNSYYTGSSWAWVSGDEFEAVLYGPLGILPLDYILSGQGVNPQTYPSNHKPGTLVFNGTQNCVNQVSADIIERLTVVDRDNAGDWVRQGTGVGTTPGALNPVQSLPCNGYFSQYGAGCVSSSGSPVLMGTGCPTPGGSLTVELVYAPTGATSMIVLGLGNLSIPISACCALQVNPIVNPQIFLVMPATYLTLPATIPATLPTPVDAYVQVLFGDAANPCGISASNPLQIHFQ